MFGGEQGRAVDHPEGLEQALLDELRDRHAGDDVDHRGEGVAGVIGVAEALAGSELEGLRLGQGRDLLNRLEGRQVLPHHQAEREAAAVAQQHAHGDLAQPVHVVGGQVLGDRIAGLQLALVDQHPNGSADQRLGHRAHAVDAARLQGRLGLPIAPTVSSAQENAAVLDDQQLAPDDLPLFHEAGDQGVQSRESLRRDLFSERVADGEGRFLGQARLGRNRREQACGEQQRGSEHGKRGGMAGRTRRTHTEIRRPNSVRFEGPCRGSFDAC